MKDLIVQSLLNIPVLFLTVSVLALALSVKSFRQTGFFIAGSIVSLLNIASGLILWSTEPTASELRSHMMLNNILFSSQSILFLLGVIQTLLEKRSSLAARQYVFLLILFNIVTLGFYLPFWYVKQPAKYRLNNSLIILFVMLWMPVLLMYVYEYIDERVDPIAIVLTEIAAGMVAIVMSFRLRNKIQENNEVEIDPILTFLFGVFYLQYKINQIEAEKLTPITPS